MATYAWPHIISKGRRSGWAGYLVGNTGVLVLYFLLPQFGASEWVGSVVYLGVSAAAGIAIVLGVRRHRPGGHSGWSLLAAGQFMFAAAEFSAYAAEYLGGGYQEPAVADVLYLGAYPLLAAGMLTFVRRRTPGWDVPSALDAAIVAVGAGLAGWVFLVQPLTVDTSLSTAAKAVQGAYPIADLLLLVIAVRMVLGTGVRTVSFLLLTASVVLLLGADTGYAILNLLGVNQFVSPLDALWLTSYVLLGAAALHPSMRRVDERSATATPDATVGRLVLLTVAVLAAPAVQVAQHVRGGEVHVLLVAASCTVMFLLVMVRMAGLVAAQRSAAITDGLTGLKTRRYFEQALATEIQRAVRTGHPVGLLIVDIDHFKQINDTHGHQGGDRVLIEIARRLTAGTRAGTIVARYGGEEFALLFPQTDPAGITTAAENIRRAVGNTPFTVRTDTLVTVTASLGAACLPDHADTAEALILTAANALYAAKDAGRNRAVISHTAPKNPRALHDTFAVDTLRR